MKTLRQALEDYLALRRAMGFKLSEAGTLLPQFVEGLAQRGATRSSPQQGRGMGDPTQHVQPADGRAACAACGALRVPMP